jgi:methylmalonyl-CoA/ethylmalonyl-CoA epimerase
LIPLFQELHHICIVVRDLDKAVAYYERLQIGPWYDYPKGSKYVELDVPNPAGSAAMRYKCCDFKNFQLQLCQPSEHDTPQKRFLDTHGEGVYHFGFEVPNLAAAEAFGSELGLNVISRGRRIDESGFCYFDTQAEAGVVLEIRKTAESQP